MNKTDRRFYTQLREADKRFYEERDRRYTEVNIEREKALKIKETADLAALGLAREIQTYKDEKANQLREQINSERGLYASKDDLAAAEDKIMANVRPLSDYIASQQGRTGRERDFRDNKVGNYVVVGAAATVVTAVIMLITVFITHH